MQETSNATGSSSIPPASCDNWNLLVFRDGKRRLALGPLLEELESDLFALQSVSLPAGRDFALGPLLRAGELETGVVDAASLNTNATNNTNDTSFARAAGLLAKITDAAAAALVTGYAPLQLSALCRQLRQVALPPEVFLSPPEGFAYYALHPLDYVALVRAIGVGRAPAAVIGLRSIGTTLSAVVAEAFRPLGGRAERITVRPEGHPFDRVTNFSAEQQGWVHQQQQLRAEFFLVDEGPGLSGSSFLSVSDALIRLGTPAAKITILCGHEPDLGSLCAARAEERWGALKWASILPGREVLTGASLPFSWGTWRNSAFESREHWPGSWIHHERLKFLSPDRQHLFKFDGLAHHGLRVFERYRAMSTAGFGPEPFEEGAGFHRFEMLRMKATNPCEINRPLLDRLADYCAARVTLCAAAVSDTSGLVTMALHNITTEFGLTETRAPQAGLTKLIESFAGGPDLLRLPMVKAVVADAKMMPYEWLGIPERLIKLDGASHGDDHFYPGPTDIAWDLAGVIVEWDLDSSASDYFLARYQARSGDRPAERIGAYKLAYLTFRMAYTKLGSQAMKGTDDQPRLWRDYLAYRLQLDREISLGFSGA